MLEKDIIIPIYRKWQTNENLIGKAILIEKVRDGNTFIIDDTYSDDMDSNLRLPEAYVTVYSYERWKVQFKELTSYGEQTLKLEDVRDHNIRYIHNIGVSSSFLGHEEDTITSDIKDNFIQVDGVEVF